MVYSQLKIRDLELLIAIGEECNLREVARRTGLSEPALSKRLRRMEQQAHVILFSRTASGLASTVAGRAFLERVRISVQHFHQALHDAHQAALGDVRRIRVGVSSDQGVYPMTLIQSIYSQGNKNVHYEVHVDNSAELMRGLQSQHLDVAMLTSPAPNGAIVTAPIATRPFAIWMRPDHPLAERASLRLEDAAEYPWILFSRNVHPPLHDLICETAREKGLSLRILHSVCHVDQASALLTDDNTLIWLMPIDTDSSQADGFVSVNLEDERIRIVTLLATRATNRSRLIGEFCRCIAKTVEVDDYSKQMSLPIASPVYPRAF